MRRLAFMLALLAAGCSLMVPARWDDVDGTSDATETVGDGADVPGDVSSDGDVICTPYQRECHENRWEECNDAGTEWNVVDTCESGEVCVDSMGCVAETACSMAASEHRSTGCEFWTVPLPIDPLILTDTFQLGLVITNTSDSETVHFSVLRGESSVFNSDIAPSSGIHVGLDFIEAQTHAFPDDNWTSLAVTSGAYYIVTDIPVSVWQVNPRHFKEGSDYSMHASMSLLLPEHSLGTSYAVLAMAPLNTMTTDPEIPSNSAAYLSIVGTSDTTSVTVTAGGDIAAGGTIPATSGGSTLNLEIGAGEVVNLAAAVPADCLSTGPGCLEASGVRYCYDPDLDLTNTRIEATQPVAVFVGNVAVDVPYMTETSDHIAEQVPPIETLGRQFATAPVGRAGETDVRNLVKILCPSSESCLVHVTPAQDGVGTETLEAGEFISFMLSDPAMITSTEPVLVAQFLVGRGLTTPMSDIGDPAMTWLVPLEQWTDTYAFEAPHQFADGTDSSEMYLMVVREPTTSVTMDMTLMTDWTDIGSGSYRVAVVPLSEGIHFIEADGRVGVTMWGFGLGVGIASPVGMMLNSL